MVSTENTSYTDNASDYIEFSYSYFTDNTVTSESYYNTMNSLRRYENEKPRIPSRVFYNKKTTIKPFKIKSSKNVRFIKQFIGHSFKIGKSKK